MISKNKVKYVRSLEMKKFRKADAVFVAEGYKLVGDLLDVFECTYLVATAEWLLAHDVWVHKLNNRGVEVDEVTEEEVAEEKPKRSGGRKVLIALGVLLAVAVVLLGAYVGLSRLNPEIFDSIFYSAEELEILNYRK